MTQPPPPRSGPSPAAPVSLTVSPLGPSAAGATKGDVLPEWFPPWAVRLAELYFSRTTSMFVLHGNTLDVVASDRPGPDGRYGTLVEFLTEQIFGRWDLVLHYDLSTGLRAFAGRDDGRLRHMISIAEKRLGDLVQLKRDPASVIAVLERFVRHNIVASDADRVSVALLIDHVSYIVPAGEPGRLTLPSATFLVTLANWAASPYVKAINMAFVLIDEKLANVSERLATHPHVATLQVPLPDAPARRAFLETTVGPSLGEFSDYSSNELAELTAGISLTDLNVLVRSTKEGRRRLDAKVFKELKKRLLERQAQGLLEFIEPKWSLDTVIGHEAAKARLREDAALLARGALDSMPMGYLLCGPVGTGKSFLAQCAAGELGVPCVMLKNFRSKYVGETEGNLERVLSVLRAMGPVVVVVDEADAALGDRESEGDAGTSSRVFGLMATQMGDTRYRGRIIWMLLTARPDLLPIDIKRQGRAEVHIPLFYPTDEGEIRQMFVVLAKKLGATIALHDVPPVPQKGHLSGADIESLVSRAWRTSLIGGHSQITKEALAEAVEQFMPSTQGLERDLQEVAAILECTDRQFLPAVMMERLEREGGRARLQEKLTHLKHMVKAL